MNKQTIIDCLEAIRSDIQAGNGQQALRDLNKLEHCINLCDCSGVIVASVHVEVNDDFPAILREQAI